MPSRNCEVLNSTDSIPGVRWLDTALHPIAGTSVLSANRLVVKFDAESTDHDLVVRSSGIE